MRYSLLEVYGIGAIGYFFRPVGGMILGHFGDKYGRKCIFLTTMVLMTFATLMMAGIPVNGSLKVIGPYMLILCRILQGIAIGAEMSGAQSIVYEHLKKKKRIFGLAVTMAGTSVGIILATGIVSLMTGLFGSDGMYNWGWRTPFVIGAVLGGIGLMLRTTISETPQFEKLMRKNKVSKAPFKDLIKEHKVEFTIYFLLVLIGGTLTPIFDSLMPMILNQNLGYGLSTALSLGTVVVVAEGIFTLVIPFCIKDHITLKKVIIFLYITLAVIVVPSFYLLFYIKNIFLAVIILFILGAVFGGICGTFAFIGVSLFPTKVRFTGVATSLNIAMAFGAGLTPVMTTLVMEEFKSIYAIPCYVILYSLLTACVIVFLIYRNRQGKSYYN